MEGRLALERLGLVILVGHRRLVLERMGVRLAGRGEDGNSGTWLLGMVHRLRRLLKSRSLRLLKSRRLR